MSSIDIYKLNLYDFNLDCCDINMEIIIHARQKYRLFQKYKEYIASMWLRCFVLQNKYLFCKYEDIVFDVTNTGRPFLKYSNYDFNISHNQKYIVMAVVKYQRVGIDIEELNKNNIDILAVAKKYYSDIEYQWLNSLSIDDKYIYFYLIWTLKEAILKWNGLGIACNLSCYYFIFKNFKLYLSSDINVQKPYYFNTKIDNDNIMSLATTYPITNVRLINIQDNVFLNPVMLSNEY